MHQISLTFCRKTDNKNEISSLDWLVSQKKKKKKVLIGLKFNL